MTARTALERQHLNSRRLIGLGALGVTALLVILAVLEAAQKYPGQQWLFLLFIFSYVALVTLAVPRPRLFGYTTLAAFLFLGFSAKAVAYFGLGIALIEPIGTFDGSGRAWDAALVPALAGCSAIIVVRLVHLAVFRERIRRPEPIWAAPPDWYARTRVPVLAASAVGLVMIHAFNLVSATYQIGVLPRFALPAHLAVPISWVLASGSAIWAATLLGWEVGLSPSRLGRSLLIPVIEAVASVTTLSRAAFLFRGLSYVLVAAEYPPWFRARLNKGWQSVLIAFVPVGFAVSVAGVSLLRIAIYPALVLPPPSASAPSSITASPAPTASGAAQSPQEARIALAGREIGTAVFGRWIGIEGSMAASSYGQLSLDLLSRALVESPALGESSLYQRISGSYYQTTGRFVFLTTPGAIGVLYLSGSVLVVFAGMALLTALLISFEMLASRFLANSFTVSLMVITLANAIANLNFPYLFLVLLLEQAVAVMALWLIGRRVAILATQLRATTMSQRD